MKHRSGFNKLRHAVPQAVGPQTLRMLEFYEKYFSKFEDHKEIQWAVFLPSLQRWYPGIKEEDMAVYTSIVRNLGAEVDEGTAATIMQDLYELDLATKVANACAMYDAGELKTSISQFVAAQMDEYKHRVGAKDVSWVNTPIGELLENDMNDVGVKWRLKCLRDSLKPLRPGHAGIIAARPDKGKTSFLASECTYMASQLQADRNIIWLNNEGLGENIVPRLYQAALCKTTSELIELHKAGQLEAEYEKEVGRLDRIRVIDVHGFTPHQLEHVLDNSNPGLIMFDMLPQVNGFHDAGRPDLRIEHLAQWARERAVKYDSIVFSTMQVSAEGEGETYPNQSMLKDSKTGVQGACDFIMMLGHSNAQELSNNRWISLPKNKLRRQGAKQDPRAQVMFDAERARYSDIQEGT